jgi:hypothetical protein
MLTMRALGCCLAVQMDGMNLAGLSRVSSAGRRALCLLLLCLHLCTVQYSVIILVLV